MTYKGRYSYRPAAYRPAAADRAGDGPAHLPAPRDLAIVRDFGAQGIRLVTAPDTPVGSQAAAAHFAEA